MENKFLNKKGQNLLEAAFSIIVAAVLLGGIINIWVWGNNQIVRRQLRYNETRVAAGTARDENAAVWPVYRPEELAEDKVLLNYPK